MIGFTEDFGVEVVCVNGVLAQRDALDRHQCCLSKVRARTILGIGRKALWEQLQFALDGEPDPWFDFKDASVDTRQFNAITA